MLTTVHHSEPILASKFEKKIEKKKNWKTYTPSIWRISFYKFFFQNSLNDGLLDDFYESGKEFPALTRY